MTTIAITHREALLLEAYGPLEMARVIVSLTDELAWIAAFASVRAKDDSKTFARVNRGALRNISQRAEAAFDAQAIEARRAGTEGSGAKHESAVACDAPEGGSHD